jgi:hypothetical protein
MMWGLRRLLEACGGLDALPTLDGVGHRPWYAEGRVTHLVRW